jgi:hypothetical protein
MMWCENCGNKHISCERASRRKDRSYAQRIMTTDFEPVKWGERRIRDNFPVILVGSGRSANWSRLLEEIEADAPPGLLCW